MTKTKLAHRIKNSPRKKKIIVAVILVILLGLAIYFVRFHKSTVTNTPSTTQEEDEALVKKGESPKNANSQQSSQSDKQNQPSSSDQSIIQPQGNFVSNHTVTSLTDSIESICNTNTGASCEITFKQGGIVKTVGQKATDSKGTASWVWTPSSIGLSGGRWEIVAISTYNGKVAEQSDPRQLEVKL